jgi:DNA-binding winged helix-turn-helix (wHTH) protein/Flp pilus assembly protein TadD
MMQGAARVAFGVFELDRRRGRLCKSGRRVRLAPQAMRALDALVMRAGSTVTRDELRQSLWPHGTHVVFDTALNTTIRKIRLVLGDSAADPAFIQTVPGIGYRFVALVREITPEEPRPAVRPVAVAAHRFPAAMRAGLLSAVCVALAALVAADSRPALVAHLIDMGRANLEHGVDDASAHHRFEQASRLAPGSADVWGWLALSHARAGRRPHARLAAARAVRIDPSNWTANAALASLDSPADAVCGNGALVAEGREAVAARFHVEYACRLKRLGRPDLALVAIDEALTREPVSGLLMAYRGLLLHAVGRYDEEMPTLLAAVGVEPQSPQVHLHLGLGYARRRHFDSALAALRRAVDLSGGARETQEWLRRIEREQAGA